MAVLQLAGEFDSFETELVRKGFEACLADGHNRIVVDLAEMSFANSTTLAFFITAHNRVEELGGRLLLAKPTDFILKTMKTLGLQQVLKFADSVDDAVAELQKD